MIAVHCEGRETVLAGMVCLLQPASKQEIMPTMSKYQRVIIFAVRTFPIIIIFRTVVTTNGTLAINSPESYHNPIIYHWHSWYICQHCH